MLTTKRVDQGRSSGEILRSCRLFFAQPTPPASHLKHFALVNQLDSLLPIAVIYLNGSLGNPTKVFDLPNQSLNANCTPSGHRSSPPLFGALRRSSALFAPRAAAPPSLPTISANATRAVSKSLFFMDYASRRKLDRFNYWSAGRPCPALLICRNLLLIKNWDLRPRPCQLTLKWTVDMISLNRRALGCALYANRPLKLWRLTLTWVTPNFSLLLDRGRYFQP